MATLAELKTLRDDLQTKLDSGVLSLQGPSLEDVKRVHDLEAERRYWEEMDDTSKPLSNASILEWSRRRERRS